MGWFFFWKFQVGEFDDATMLTAIPQGWLKTGSGPSKTLFFEADLRYETPFELWNINIS